MTKTVKQLVDEYLAKNDEQKRTFDEITVIQINGCNSIETVEYKNVEDIGMSAFPYITLHGYDLYKMNFTCMKGTRKHKMQVIGDILKFSEPVEE